MPHHMLFRSLLARESTSFNRPYINSRQITTTTACSRLHFPASRPSVKDADGNGLRQVFPRQINGHIRSPTLDRDEANICVEEGGKGGKGVGSHVRARKGQEATGSPYKTPPPLPSIGTNQTTIRPPHASLFRASPSPPPQCRA